MASLYHHHSIICDLHIASGKTKAHAGKKKKLAHHYTAVQ